MAKIMLVEDDNNLREIYEARLLAEGYEIVSAKDGEEALALAVKERPDLIISDVMMPKISGFDMLDILRSTPETKDTKVIMMTALSQAEDKTRADKLGADRYLVKSQVTLEDVAKVAREVLSGESASPAAPPAPPAPQQPPAGPPQEPPASPPTPTNPPAPPPPVSPPTDPTTPAPPAGATTIGVVQAPSSPPIDSPRPTSVSAAEPTAQEQAEVNQQIENFITNQVPTNQPNSDINLSQPAVTPIPVTMVPEATPPVTPAQAATKIEVVEAPSDDKASVAAENADKLAATVNEIMDKQAADSEQHSSDGVIANKKVIKPINSIADDRKKLDALLEREELAEQGLSLPNLPSSSANTDPNQPISVQSSTDASPEAAKQTIGTPGLPGTDPNSIAL